MKLIIKSLKQKLYEIDLQDDKDLTIYDIKTKLEETHGFDKASLKLLFNGKVLSDPENLSTYSIEDGSVIAMLSCKVKPINTMKEEVKEEEKVYDNTEDIKSYKAELAELINMGYNEKEAESAIDLAQGNVSLAVDYLLAEKALIKNSDDNILQISASIVKVLSKDKPKQLRKILLSLKKLYPSAYEAVRQREEEFGHLLEEPLNEQDEANYKNFLENYKKQKQASKEQNKKETIPNKDNLNKTNTKDIKKVTNPVKSSTTTGTATKATKPVNAVTNTTSATNNATPAKKIIKLPKKDFEAVNRLKEFGFTQKDVLEAYFACDKNEELAANFLFDTKQNKQEVFKDCM
jgi:Holliday junction resolvasome RuvABC DNA-binding subunit